MRTGGYAPIRDYAAIGDGAIASHTCNAGEPEPGHGAVEGRFVVGDGTSALFALGAASQEPLVLPSPDQVERRVDATASFWRSWAARLSYDGPWRRR